MENADLGRSTIRKALDYLASPAILFVALPWLMIILTVGTIAQKELGLYIAQEKYFSSWIFWFGPLPLPGSYLTLGLITLCLSAKFLLYSPWRKHQTGIILSHLGVLVLLIGGLVTAVTQKEGFMLLGEGQSGSAVSDYHARVLRIEKDGEAFAQISYDRLIAGEPVTITSLPFTIEIVETCENCMPQPAPEADDRRGLAEKISLSPAPLNKEAETNLSGATYTIRGAGKDQDGLYVTMEEIPHRASIDAGNSVYDIYMDRQKTVLPFTITLSDFARETHPGTDMASGFSSDVIVRDSDGSEWPYHIRMNEPMRYKGYTFYQASFSIRPDGEFSVLSVVENKGRIFPYLASGILFAGLMIHVGIRLSARRKDAA